MAIPARQTDRDRRQHRARSSYSLSSIATSKKRNSKTRINTVANNVGAYRSCLEKATTLYRIRSLQNAERLIVLRTAPEYLILSLNRFEYDKHTNVFRKVFTRMNYPRILSVHVSPPSAPRSTAKYSLVLIIVHTGYTLHGGHYYVYARDMRSDDEWFLFNDDIVTASSYEAIMDNCAQYSSATPYVVFYQRVDSRRTEATIRVRESLVQQVQEDNSNYERESER